MIISAKIFWCTWKSPCSFIKTTYISKC